MMWFVGVAWATCTVFSGAEVYLEQGPETGVTVVIDEGEIVGVGKGLRNLKLSMDGQGQVDAALWGGRACDFEVATGWHLTAGLTEVSSSLGLVEIDLEAVTSDFDSEGDPIRAALPVAVAYNPRSTVIPVQRAFGITSAVVRPHGGLVAGTAAWVELTGSRQSEAVRDSAVAVHASLGYGASRAQAWLGLSQLLDDARDYQRNEATWERNARRPYAEAASRVDLAAMVPVLDREVPLVVDVDRASDIEAVLGLAENYGIRVVISGGAEAWLVADALAAAKVPVILNPLVYRPGSFDQVHARPDNAALLSEAGVTMVISTFSTHDARELRQLAGNAVRAGLPHHAAVLAITSAPADVFGVSGTGRIKVGERANLVLWAGDPLELSSAVKAVYIGGEAMSLDHRQKQLLERYRELPGQAGPLGLQ